MFFYSSLQPVYHWIERRESPQGPFIAQFFDTQSTRTPVRFDFKAPGEWKIDASDFVFHGFFFLLGSFAGRQAIQIDYREFDQGSQSAAIYNIPTQILAVCNPVSLRTEAKK